MQVFGLISDVVVQTIATNAFWLTVILVTILAFRKQIASIVGSVASFKVAGASFELKDRKATLEYYAVLTNVLLEILSQRDSAEKLTGLLSTHSVQQLAKFSLKYIEEVPSEDVDIELLKNVALIIGRRGQTQDAISFYDSLLKQKPNDPDLLNLKGIALLDSETKDVISAEQIFSDLIKRYPASSLYWYNRGCSRSLLEKFDECIVDATRAIELGVNSQHPAFFEDTGFRHLERSRPDEFKKLQALCHSSS